MYLVRSEFLVYFDADQTLRVGLGQNGQILFISVEQLSLNVAGDSAKTSSVLRNKVVQSMTVASDLCRWVGDPAPQNTPDFGGPTDFSIFIT